jgi:hypothetical protein
MSAGKLERESHDGEPGGASKDVDSQNAECHTALLGGMNPDPGTVYDPMNAQAGGVGAVIFGEPLEVVGDETFAGEFADEKAFAERGKVIVGGADDNASLSIFDQDEIVRPAEVEFGPFGNLADVHMMQRKRRHACLSVSRHNLTYRGAIRKLKIERYELRID